MRSIWFLVALAGCVDATDGPADSGTTLPVYAGELLHNGNFEQLDTTGFPTDWELHDFFTDEGTIAAVHDPKFDAYALQWDVLVTGREFWVTQSGLTPAQIQPGHVYELTGWFRTDHVGDLAFNYILRGEPGDDPDIDTVPLPAMGPTEPDVWQHFSYDLAVPFDATAETYDFTLHSIKYSGGEGHLLVDGVSLHPKP